MIKDVMVLLDGTAADEARFAAVKLAKVGGISAALWQARVLGGFPVHWHEMSIRIWTPRPTACSRVSTSDGSSWPVQLASSQPSHLRWSCW